jgi:hypothetical protein
MFMRVVLREKQLLLLNKYKSDLGEQEETSTPEPGSEDVQSTTKAGEQKWESGATRGPGNQIAVTKWSDIVGSTITRGKSNPLW